MVWLMRVGIGGVNVTGFALNVAAIITVCRVGYQILYVHAHACNIILMALNT